MLRIVDKSIWLEPDRFYDSELIVDIFVIFSDELSFLSFISQFCWPIIIKNYICSKSCDKKKFYIVKHLYWGWSVSPLENRKFLRCFMGVYNFFIFTTLFRILIVIAFDIECYLWRATPGSLNTFKSWY